MGKLTILNNLKACAEAAKKYTSSLVSELARTVTEAMEEMESVKSDKQKKIALTIPTTGWVEDKTIADYPNYCDITATGVTATDRVDIAIDPNSMATAITCGLCPTNQTLEGTIRVYAKSVPAAAISAEYWLNQGKE
mgnify:FL=1